MCPGPVFLGAQPHLRTTKARFGYMESIKVLVIDDEKNARELLLALLRKYCPEAVTDQAEDIPSAIDRINRNPPDLLFVDIHLRDGNGFDLLEKIGHLHFQVIFVSAYDTYTMKACKASALDYLLKPIDPEEFREAVDKARQRIRREKLAGRVDVLIQNLPASSKPRSFILKTADSIHVVNTDEVIYCEADGNYTTFHLAGGRNIMVSKSLAEYEEMIGSPKFIRTHQSYLVNMDHVTRYERGGSVVTDSGAILPVSTRKRESVLQFLQNL